MTFYWTPPSIGASLTSGYKLSCIPLLQGIPFPHPLQPPPNATSAILTGLFSGVDYNCSLVTITAEGTSLPNTLSFHSPETGNHHLNLQYPSLDISAQLLQVLQETSVQMWERGKFCSPGLLLPSFSTMESS